MRTEEKAVDRENKYMHTHSKKMAGKRASSWYICGTIV